jgi:hypothetical protein
MDYVETVCTLRSTTSHSSMKFYVSILARVLGEKKVLPSVYRTVTYNSKLSRARHIVNVGARNVLNTMLKLRYFIIDFKRDISLSTSGEAVLLVTSC